MGESQRGSLLHVRLDVRVVDRRNGLVGQQDHDDVGILDGLGDFVDLETGLLGLFPRHAALAQANGDLDPGILQVLRVRMTLRAITNDGDLLALDERQVGVLVVINLH